jgi:hypothetical protein
MAEALMFLGIVGLIPYVLTGLLVIILALLLPFGLAAEWWNRRRHRKMSRETPPSKPSSPHKTQ